MGGNSTDFFSHYIKNFELNYFTISVAKTANYLRISHKAFSILKQQM